ncbi:MAG TPA: patatin-like phospholipase family protein [Pyrinomonadaceae bacterium]|jgi:NTE family protein|nr:patatin-like phospholipase family protein [Pyrinomonadaceae bacterium]
MTDSKSNRVRVGLALSGGAARGIAHVGVLRALVENNIPIDAIAGASAGALIGGCYAAGVSIDRLVEMSRTFRWRHVQRPSFSRLGLQSNAPMEKFLRAQLPVTRFEDLKIPFAAMVTDLMKGELIVMRDRGDIPFAIRASCCIPFFMAPAQDENGTLLIDGGIVQNLPISQTRALDADVVVSVDVNLDGIRFFDRPRTALGVLAHTFIAVERIVSNQERADADVVIAPKVGHIRWDQTRRSKELVECGYQAGLESIEAIEAAMARAKPSKQLKFSD